MIDTHCHLTSRPLLDQIEQVVGRARDAGVDRVISVATDPDDAQVAVEQTRRFEGVYATVGVHPHEASRWTDRRRVVEALRRLACDPKVVALGEMGLDKHYSDPPMPDQRRLFDWQLEAAAALSLPVVIHNRQATDEVLEMIRHSGIPGSRFVFHCFTGTRRELDAVLALGAMVSFTGVVTFKNASALSHDAAGVPLDRVMIETDAPYLTPEPHRKVKTNEPCYVPWVARHLAAGRTMQEQDLVSAADRNAERFFGLA